MYEVTSHCFNQHEHKLYMMHHLEIGSRCNMNISHLKTKLWLKMNVSFKLLTLVVLLTQAAEVYVSDILRVWFGKTQKSLLAFKLFPQIF